MRKLFLTLTSAIFFLQLSATGDSLNYLTAKDTVFLKVDYSGNKILEHRLAKGQTLYSLSRFYGLKIEALYAFNTGLSVEGNFTEGQQVNVPIPDSAIVKSWQLALPKDKFAPVYYSVKQGDTFYSIAKHMFQIPMDTLKIRNGLQNTDLSNGQLILVGWLSLEGIPKSLQLSNTSPVSLTMLQLQSRFEAAKMRKKPSFQNGAAYWQRDKDAGNDYYALHRTAPSGSIIQVANPITKKIVYAKVIGAISDRIYDKDIVVVLSPSIAKLLDARDSRFFVELWHFGK